MSSIILPYDGSPVARAALRRAANIVERHADGQNGIILAVAGGDRDALDAVRAEARAIAGADVPLRLEPLTADDPIGALQRLADARPDASLAAPLNPRGCAPWYATACRHGGRAHHILVFMLSPREIAAFEPAARHSRQPRAVHRAGPILNLGAHLRPRLHFHGGPP